MTLFSDFIVESISGVETKLKGLGPLNWVGRMMLVGRIKKITRQVLIKKTREEIKDVLCQDSIIDQLYIHVLRRSLSRKWFFPFKFKFMCIFVLVDAYLKRRHCHSMTVFLYLKSLEFFVKVSVMMDNLSFCILQSSAHIFLTEDDLKLFGNILCKSFNVRLSELACTVLPQLDLNISEIL